MSTTGVIYRADENFISGVYHHSDSYPSGLGKALWDLYHGYFASDLKLMLKTLIDDHPAGWSSIVDTNFNLDIGYGLGNNHPACYCHGKRNEKANLLKWAQMPNFEYAYILKVQDYLLEVVKNGGKRFLYSLNGTEPDWESIE